MIIPASISSHGATKGWPYVVSWLHRLAGLVLVGFLVVHVYTLLQLESPAAYEGAVQDYNSFLLAALEWGLCLPLIFHAANGGRLLLYELFGWRNDTSMRRWVLSITAAYAAMMALFGWRGDQEVSATFFWLLCLASGSAFLWLCGSRLQRVPHRLSWRLHRLSAAFLLAMAPGHMLFMHLNPWVARKPEVVIARLQSPFIEAVDLALLAAVVYHGGCGLITVAADYIDSRPLLVAVQAAVALLLGVTAVAGIWLLLVI